MTNGEIVKNAAQKLWQAPSAVIQRWITALKRNGGSWDSLRCGQSPATGKPLCVTLHFFAAWRESKVSPATNSFAQRRQARKDCQDWQLSLHTEQFSQKAFVPFSCRLV
jgi:hypothetical protein